MKLNKFFMIAGGALLVASMLGIPEGRLARSEAGNGPATITQQNGASVAYAIEKVTPAVFRGDVRYLPQVSLKGHPERPELTPPFDAKQLLPEANAPQTEEPNIPLAPMPLRFKTLPG